MTFRPPSRKQMVLLFLIVGPMLWPYAMLLAGPHPPASVVLLNSGSPITYLSFIFIGFGAWWMFAWSPTYWLITWVPTVLAALVAERVLYIVCKHYHAAVGSRALLIVISCIVCGVISAVVFAPLQLIAFRPPKLTDMGSLNQLVLVVAIIGAWLGIVVGAWPRLTPADPAGARSLN